MPMSVKIWASEESGKNEEEYVHIDLFSGIGGFALGFQKAGLNIVEHFFSEIDKNAINIYIKHFPKAKELGDVTTIRDFSELRRACAGKIVVITFGFPCQDLSVAGKGAGLAGARSGLFFEAIRIVKELNPQYFIFENVKGLLTNNRGADFVRCLREIADIGLYDCEWQLVNTSWFLPQNRERVYFIGHLRGQSAPQIFPVQESNKKTNGVQGQYAKCLTTKGTNTNGTYVAERKQLPKIGKDGKLKSKQHLASCLTGGGHSGGNHSDMDLIVQRTKMNPQSTRVNGINGNSVTLSALGGGGGARTGLYVVPRGNNQGGYKEVDNCPTITKSSFETNNFICPVLTPNREEKRQNGRRFKNNGEPSFTLTTQDQHGIFNGVDIRRLTPLECERLQGFPDGWTEYGTDGKKISDSARYKALGNAVSVPIPELIGNKLREFNN